MIGQQLDLFGGPLRPPKKILEDEPQEEKVLPAKHEPDTHPETFPEDEAEIATDGEYPLADLGEPFPEDESATTPFPQAYKMGDVENEKTNGTDTGDELARNTTVEEETAPELIEETESSLSVIMPQVGNPQEPQLEEDKGDISISKEDTAGDLVPQQVAFRGRKTADPEEEMEMLNVPPDEQLFKRQYYSMRETAAMFNVNQSLLRFWENEFDVLQPKKNKKGDRYFRPIDVKNLVLIYHLLRVRKFTMEGAKDYLQQHRKAGDTFELVKRLEKLKSFLLELKANL